MTSIRSFSVFAVALLHLAFKAAQADNLDIVAQEVGSDVVIRFEGSIDTSEFHRSREVTTTRPGFVDSKTGACSFAKAGVPLTEYIDVLMTQVILGSRGINFATRSSGDSFSMHQVSLSLSPDYVSGSPLRGEMIFAGKTLRSMGFDPSYVWLDSRTWYGNNRIRIEFLERARADLRINDNGSGAAGIRVIDPGIARPAQTIRHSRSIYKANSAVAHLWLANIGDVPANFSLRSYGDRHPGMAASFKWKDRNVTGAVLTGRFAPRIEGNRSTKVIYRLKTSQFYAGVLRGGDRDELVRFRLSGAGTVDNAAMAIRYSRGLE